MSSPSPTNDARLNFRLSAASKETIEEAAALLGQTVSDFAVSTLVQSARSVIEQENITRLSKRDRDLFLALLDDTTASPNPTLKAAARKYKDRCG